MPLTSLIGRECEIHRVLALLLRSDVRLVTLTGPGGVGKTRLMLEIASRVGDDYQDGAIVVELASILDPELVLPEIARAIGVPSAVASSLHDQLQASLAGRYQLLVLDNFEHVIEAAPGQASPC